MTNELVVTEQSNPYAIMPVLDFRAAAARRQAVLDFTAKMMVAKVDYGVVPGTNDKPTLLKPGAEKLASLFGLSPDFDPIETVMDWTGEAHGGEPFFFIRYRCTLKRGDLVVGQGVGSCNSWEKKYRYRNVYPERASEEEKQNGRLETRKGKGGKPYQVYVIKNPDPADVANTIDKMAQKRALVAAVLIAVNASELFTQDMEDYSDIVDGDWQPAPAQPQPEPVDPGPLPDDEQVVYETSAREFIPAAAAILETDLGTVKARLRALGYERIPGDKGKRLDAFRRLKTDLGPNVQAELFGEDDTEPEPVKFVDPA